MEFMAIIQVKNIRQKKMKMEIKYKYPKLKRNGTKKQEMAR